MLNRMIVVVCILALAQSTFAQEAQSQPAEAASIEGAGPVPPRLEGEFVHPPLKCMARFTNITEFPMIAWCIGGGKGGPGYKYKLAHLASDAGFNCLIANPQMIRSVSQFNRMTLIPTAFNRVAGPDGKPAGKIDELRTKLAGRAGEDDPLKDADAGMKNLGLHPRMAGMLLVHNASVAAHVQTGKWLEKNYPALVPYVAANAEPGKQIGTPFVILGSQNFSLKHGVSPTQYCANLDFDRALGNGHSMTFWPMFHAPCSDSKYRLQVYAALAYGAQGVVSFVFQPNDRTPEWKEGGRLFKSAQPVHQYVRQVVGKHLWGCRSVAVYHSSRDSIPAGSGPAVAGRLVEDISRDSLVGLLSPEEEALKWDRKSATKYAMIVDKRNVPDKATVLTKPPHVDQPSAALRIVNERTGLGLAVPGDEPGQNIGLEPMSGDPHRQWAIVKAGESVAFKSRATGLVMGVGRASLDPGSKTVQWQFQEAKRSQTWKVQDLGDGTSRIVGDASRLCLTARNGMVVLDAALDGAKDQVWRIEPANQSTGRADGIYVETEVGDDALPARDVVVRFSDTVQCAEILEPFDGKSGQVRHIEPGCHVTVSLAGGDGRLLRLNPPDLAQVLGPALADYQTACAKLRLLKAEAPGSDQAKALAAEVNSLIEAASSKVADGPEAADARETLRRLRQALGATAHMVLIRAS